MLNLVRPRYFIPVHGEYRHLVKHAQLAQKVGIPAERCILAVNGEVVAFATGKLPALPRRWKRAGSSWTARGSATSGRWS